MSDKQLIRVDGLGILLLGLSALLAIAFAFTAQWTSGEVPADCTGDCMAFSDLAAQNSMAAAAWGMLAVSIFAAIVGVVTIVFLAMTLRETRQATAVARDIGEKQARAYLNINACTLKSAAFLGITDAKISIRNTGLSPARNLSVTATLRAYQPRIDDDGSEYEVVHFETESTRPIHAVSGGEEIEARTQFVSLVGPSLSSVIEADMMMIEIKLQLDYETIFGEEDTEVTKFTGASYGNQTLDRGIEMSKSSY